MPKSLRNNVIPIILIALVIAYAVMQFAQTTRPREMSNFTTLVQDVNERKVAKITAEADDTTLRVQLKDSTRATPCSNLVLPS